ncbi:MAG: hypothetical protein H6754_02985 [Candidatus Omnitrophica bacterium]|nr:hypothetical protein [Candidatus Omnitrophota bacterium]
MKKFLYKKQGQTIVEYTLLIGITIAILLAVTPMIKRGTQGMVKVVSDELGTQQNAEQVGGDGGGLIKSDVKSNFDRQQTKKEWLTGTTHSVFTGYNDSTSTDIKTEASLGVSKN